MFVVTGLSKLLSFLTRTVFGTNVAPSVVPHRRNGGHTAILFIHGFSGAADGSWARFIELALQDHSLRSWDLFSLGYPTSLRVDLPNLWSADPGLDMLALELSTTLNLPDFQQYDCLAIVAHSMGGLVAQRAILNDEDVRNRTSHLLLYGTPSNGIQKATYGRLLKRQMRDMAIDSTFITTLRADWLRLVQEGVSFTFRAIAGDRDEFVPGESVLGPFDRTQQRVVPGDHLTMMRPQSTDEQSYAIFAGAIRGREGLQTVVDGAEVALEFRRFRAVIRNLWDNRAHLDDNAIVTLALALESVGRRADALEVLEHHNPEKPATDVMGTLAGRLKRRWLAGRVRADFDRARELYAGALALAEAGNNHAQGYYHAVNIAFLDLMLVSPDDRVPPEVTAMAERALGHCANSPISHWRLAAEAEANLILGKLDEASRAYAEAIRLAAPREIESMAAQAVLVATRVHGRSGARLIGDLFGYKPRQ